MGKKIIWQEAIIIIIAVICALIMGSFHLSYDGYLFISKNNWYFIDIMTLNFMLLGMSWLIGYSYPGPIQKIFWWFLIPYFGIKIIYHFSCYTQIKILSSVLWESIWSIICYLTIIICLSIIGFTLFKIPKYGKK